MSPAHVFGVGDRLEWARDGRDWPMRASSRFVVAGGMRWHVQRTGSGPPILLVHGTGASTHSWRALAERLAPTFELVAFDLPGHGFSDPAPPGGETLGGIGELVAALLAELAVVPRQVVGHSAGAAILCRMALDGRIAPDRIFGLNAALRPYRGRVGRVFSGLARGLASSEWPARFAAHRARTSDWIDRTLVASGSHVAPEEADCYRRLASSPAHVQAALRMMAGWDLFALWRDLPRLAVPLVLVVGGRDRFVRPAESDAVLRRVPHAKRIVVADAGHLVHEECPERIAETIRSLSGEPAPRPSSR